MPNFVEIERNQMIPEVTAKFFVLAKDESAYISGWIALEENLEQFISVLREEMQYAWNMKDINMDDYPIFHIDIEDNNRLKELNNNQDYQIVKNSKNIYLVILHKEIPYRIIENIPPVFNWFNGAFQG